MKKTIAFITYLHLHEKLAAEVDQLANFNRVLEDVGDQNPDMIVLGGDLCGDGYYPDLFAKLGKFREKLFLIPGNHDQLPQLLQFFSNPDNAELPELYYSFKDENFLYLFLDSSSGRISEPQLKWLGEKLDGNHLKIALFIHHPVYEVQSYVDRKYPLENRDAVRELLENQQFEVFIYCGHYHCEDLTGYGAISQFTTPAVSYQIKKETGTLEIGPDTFGYRLISIENGNITSKIITLSLI